VCVCVSGLTAGEFDGVELDCAARLEQVPDIARVGDDALVLDKSSVNLCSGQRVHCVIPC
jgi:hypothetical protein